MKMAYNMSLFLLLFLLSFTSIHSQEGIILTIRNTTEELPQYQGTTYSLYSNTYRCQCTVREGSYSLLQYQDRTESCISSSNLSETLNVCSSLFFNDNVTYSIEPQNVSNVRVLSDTGVYADINDLCINVERVRRALSIFESLLARTVVCVYLGTCEDKDKCLKAYTNWLCTTQLKLYSLNTSSSSSSNDSDNLIYHPIKPCFGICRNVLRDCPYYLPSSVQYNFTAHSIGNGSDRVASAFVYGGYPAFACPTNTKTNINSSTYALDGCFGNEAVSLQMTQLLTVLLISVVIVLVL